MENLINQQVVFRCDKSGAWAGTVTEACNHFGIEMPQPILTGNGNGNGNGNGYGNGDGIIAA